MSDHFWLTDPMLERVHQARPLVAPDAVSTSGEEAQRILRRVLATSAPAQSAPAPRRSYPSARRGVPILAAAVVAAAVLTVVLLLVGGGSSSIISQAYAATSPAGVVVHYSERSYTVTPTGEHYPATRTEYWLSGQKSRIAMLKADGSISQDIVASPGRIENLADLEGPTLTLTVLPARTSRCTAAETLEGYCENGETPISGLRTMLHFGALKVTGHSTISGQTATVIAGATANLQVRAYVNTKTGLPIRIDLVETLGHPKGTRAYVTHSTITGYTRQPITATNEQLLNLPNHNGARVIRFRPCPTARTPQKLCRQTS